MRLIKRFRIQTKLQTIVTQARFYLYSVFDKRFRIQAKIPLRKHGFILRTFQNSSKTTVTQARLAFCFDLSTFLIQAKLLLRKHNLNCVLFYEHFRIKAKLFVMQESNRNRCVFDKPFSKLKQNRSEERL